MTTVEAKLPDEVTSSNEALEAIQRIYVPTNARIAADLPQIELSNEVPSHLGEN